MNRKDLIIKLKADFIALSREDLANLDSEREDFLERLENIPHSGQEMSFPNIWPQWFHFFPKVYKPGVDTEVLLQTYKVRKGESVLDAFTGCGIIGIHAAKNGAEKVVALDINPNAVRAAKLNVKKLGVRDKVEVRRSDVFSALKWHERFEVVVANLPFVYGDNFMMTYNEGNVYDSYYEAHSNFFKGLTDHLNYPGRVYVTDANFGKPIKMLEIAEEHGFRPVRFVEKAGKGPRKFYAFELRHK